MTDTFDTLSHEPAGPPERHALVLVVAWVVDEPGRVGECLIVPARDGVVGFGRGAGDGDRRLAPSQIRPWSIRPCAPYRSPLLSRDQLEIDVRSGVARLRNTGRGLLRVGGAVVDEVRLAPGQQIEVQGRLTLLVDRYPLEAPDWPGRSDHPFGGPDADGLVGESPAAWEIRRQLDFLGPRRPHVMVRGPSGSGKELAAAGLHRRSGRSGAFVARNATTLPEGIVDAELFGNVRNYPNVGMPARRGVVGAAERGTLFLDEIGDLPAAIQPHLLRLLDHGEYHVLGDDQARQADLRVIAATHRSLDALRQDLGARFPLGMLLPGLEARRADLPLLARHLLKTILAREADLAARFLDAAGEPRIGQELVGQLLARPWTTHVRELSAALWTALLASRGDRIDAPTDAGVPSAAAEPAPADWARFVGAAPEDIPREAIEAALAAHNGQQERTAAALGLSTRFVLVRLIKRHGIAVVRRPGE